MTKASEFIPHAECMVASGDCFRLSKCLAGASPVDPPVMQRLVKALHCWMA